MKKLWFSLAIMAIVCVNSGVYAEDAMLSAGQSLKTHAEKIERQEGHSLRIVAENSLVKPKEENKQRIVIQGKENVSEIANSDFNIVLLPEHASIRDSSGVIIEPHYPPYNLGGWRSYDKVIFPVRNVEAGTYAIQLVYSKQAYDGSTGDLIIYASDSRDRKFSPEMPHTVAFLPPTGRDWSKYREISVGTITLPQGGVYLIFEDKDKNRGEYVMNLREVHLLKQ